MADGTSEGRPPTLSPRLASIAAHIPAGARMADIGTDHAHLPVTLALSDHVASAVAIDLRPGAVAQARRTVARHHVGERVAVRQGDGLSALRPAEVDVVVVSGLGGPAIVRILAAAPATLHGVRRLVVAPQSAAWRVRRWLVTNGWALVAEDLAIEGVHGYEIAVAERGDARAAYRWPGRPAALKVGRLLTLGPLLTRSAEPHWQAHWRRKAEDEDALAVRAAAGTSSGAARAVVRHRRRAARIRGAVEAAVLAAVSAAATTTRRPGAP